MSQFMDRARAIAAARITRESVEFNPDACDCDVHQRASIPIEHQRCILKPWIVKMPDDGYMYEFDTQSDAFSFQEHYRVELGLDPITGNRVV